MTSSESTVDSWRQLSGYQVLFKTYSNTAETRPCLQVASLLEHWLCLLLAGPGILNQGCSEGMELVLLFPFPHLRGGGKAQGPWKSRVPGLRGQVCCSESQPADICTGGKSSPWGPQVEKESFLDLCIGIALWWNTQPLFAIFISPWEPWVRQQAGLIRGTQAANRLGLRHAWKAGPVGHTTSPSPGSPYDLMDRIMSTSFNFIKYFLTGSSKPSPIYISSYSSPAREQNRRLQVNLQYHFYRRPISRDQHSKGSAPVDLPELGPRWGRGAVPGDLCSLEAHPRFNRITSAVASCPCITELVTPCHWWQPAEKSLTPVLYPTVSFSHFFFFQISEISSVLWVGKDQ